MRSGTVLLETCLAYATTGVTNEEGFLCAVFSVTAKPPAQEAVTGLNTEVIRPVIYPLPEQETM